MVEKSWCKNCGGEILHQENPKNCPHCNANLKTGKIPKPKIEDLDFSESVLKPRLFLFLEIFIVWLFIFVIRTFLTIILGITTTNMIDNPLLVLLSWFITPISCILGSIIGLFVNEAIIYDKAPFPNPDDISPNKEVFSVFRITKNNARYQFLYGILFIFLFLIPLDFVINAIPGVMEYQFNSLTSLPGADGSNPKNAYLESGNITNYIVFVLFISICVGIHEEHFTRNVCVSRGRRYVGVYSSIIIFSIYFGIGHFSYLTLYIGDPNFNIYFIYAIIWFIVAFIMGSAFALFFIKKRYIWPLIFAHFINNVVSITVTWLFNTIGLSYLTITIFLYLPCLIVGIILAIKFKSKIIFALGEYRKIFPNYFKEIKKTKAKVILIVFIDLLLAIFLSITTPM
ncbi:MAG: CPBP family intramembrane metalloprotease [archaeon]|nr:CPBP family intramembrane metalloprotease [archaeon]